MVDLAVEVVAVQTCRPSHAPNRPEVAAAVAAAVEEEAAAAEAAAAAGGDAQAWA